MILDDIGVNRTMLKGILHSVHKKAIIIEAVSGEECISLYHELLESLYTIDCLFLDYQLPGMNGLETANKIRGSGYSGPMVMITAMGDDRVSELKKSGVFCDVLRKPISHDMIRRQLLFRLECHDNNPDKCKNQTSQLPQV